jgi:hypothetical protein
MFASLRGRLRPVSLVVFTMLAACGDDTTPSSGSGGATSAGGGAPSGSGGSGGSGGEGGRPPVDCIDTPGRAFALNRLFFGDTDKSGMEDPDAWRQFGFDIDGLVTTAASTDVCQLDPGADPDEVKTDGDDGIDNSFGRNIIPLLALGQPTFTSDTNESLRKGRFTLMILFEGLTGEPDQDRVLAKVYGGTNLGHAPAFDGEECWPISPESLLDEGDAASARAVFPMGRLEGNVWSSGVIDDMPLTFASDSGPITLHVRQARLTVTLDAAHEAATNGQLGGVLDTQEFLGEVKKIVPAALCGFAEQLITDKSDILADGTQDPGQTCDAISIGLGFEMGPIKLGSLGPAAQPGPSNCP